jgi:hypothetical protein
MSKRVRGGKEDAYRWQYADGLPNPEQSGTIGGATIIPIVTAGALITLTADVSFPDVLFDGEGIVTLWDYYNPIVPGPISSGFLALGCAILCGSETGNAPPGPAAREVAFRLGISSPPNEERYFLWTSTAKVVGPDAHWGVSSLNPAETAYGFHTRGLGANSYNPVTLGPFTNMSLSISGFAGAVEAGWARVVVWGVEF